MAIRAAHHRAPTALVTASHPFGGPGHSFRGGACMGRYVPTGEEWYFDPFQEKTAGIIPSLNGIILGGKGKGKSAALKILAARLSAIGAGYGQMKVAINDHKSEGENSEYAKLGEFLGCRTYDIANRSVNVFEPRLELGELNTLEMATMLCEHVFQQPLVGSNFEALKVAVFMMLKSDVSLWSLQTLLKLCLSVTDEDIDGYYEDFHNRMRQQIATRIETHAQNPSEREQFEQELAKIYERDDNLDHAQIVRSGNYIASLLASLLEGKYGRMLGGGDSLYDMRSQRAIIKDWRGVSADAVSLMRAIDYRLEINAVERGLHHLYANLELDDEDHKSMEDLTFARSKSMMSKVSRGVRKLNMSGSHRFSDYRKGGAGSTLWGYGQSILDDMGFFFIGTQPNNKEYLLELQDRLNISNSDRDSLAELPPYVFAVKLGEVESLNYVQFMPTATEFTLIPSESANEGMVNRPGIDPRQYARVAAETGCSLKG